MEVFSDTCYAATLINCCVSLCTPYCAFTEKGQPKPTVTPWQLTIYEKHPQCRIYTEIFCNISLLVYNSRTSGIFLMFGVPNACHSALQVYITICHLQLEDLVCGINKCWTEKFTITWMELRFLRSINIYTILCIPKRSCLIFTRLISWPKFALRKGRDRFLCILVKHFFYQNSDNAVFLE